MAIFPHTHGEKKGGKKHPRPDMFGSAPQVLCSFFLLLLLSQREHLRTGQMGGGGGESPRGKGPLAGVDLALSNVWSGSERVPSSFKFFFLLLLCEWVSGDIRKGKKVPCSPPFSLLSPLLPPPLPPPPLLPLLPPPLLLSS